MATNEQYEAALQAALKAKNPTLVRSIRAAMRGEVVDPFEGLSLHPEMDHLWGKPSESTTDFRRYMRKNPSAETSEE